MHQGFLGSRELSNMYVAQSIGFRHNEGGSMGAIAGADEGD